MKKHIQIAALLILVGITAWHIKKLYNAKNEPNTTYLKVGTTADYPPFCYLQDHEIVGFDIDIVQEIAQRLGKTIDIVDMPFNVLLPGLQKKRFDIIAAGLTPDPRRNQVLFTQPYYQGDPLAIITLKPNNAQSVADLAGKVVVVNDGYLADLYMSKQSGPTLKRLPSIADALLALKSKRADAFVTAMSTMKPILEQQSPPEQGNAKFNIAQIPDAREEYSLAISKENPNLHEKIKKLLEEMINDGTIKKLKTKWKLS